MSQKRMNTKQSFVEAWNLSKTHHRIFLNMLRRFAILQKYSKQQREKLTTEFHTALKRFETVEREAAEKCEQVYREQSALTTLKMMGFIYLHKTFHELKAPKCYPKLQRLPSLIARRWVGRQTQWWPRHKAIYFSWFGPELFCLLLGPPGFNCWFSSAPVFQWCCSTPQGSPGVGRNTFLSSPHLCFIIVFICDLFVSWDDPLMS